jgi:hypothetical protein
MKRLSFSDLTLYLLFLYLSNELICPPDSFKSNDNYWDKKDYLDSENEYYGFLFNYKVGVNYYYDKWFGIYYENKSFSTENPISTFSSIDYEITNNIHLYDSLQSKISIEINSNLLGEGEYDLYFKIMKKDNDKIDFSVELSKKNQYYQ